MRPRMWNSVKPALLCSAAAVGLMLGLVRAADAADAAVDKGEAGQVSAVESVLVTAQRREEKLQSVPVAVLPFTADKIRQLNAVSLEDLEHSAPGFTFAVDRGHAVGQLGIRGLIDYSSTPGYDARVGVYLDGVYIRRSYADNQTLLGMERVEVLRGPQGAAFGMNTDAGAISYVTRKPDKTLAAQASADYSSFNHSTVQGRVNLPVTDKLFAAVTVSKENSDGFIRNIFRNEDLTGVDRLSTRIQLRYQPSESLDINLSYSGQWEHDTSIWTEGVWTPTQWSSFQSLFPQYAGVANPGVYQIASANPQYESSATQFLIGTIDWTINSDLKLTSISAYQTERYRNLADANDLPANGRYYDLNQNAHQFSQEVRLASDPRKAFSYIVGGYFQSGKNTSTTTYRLGPDFAALTLWSRKVPVALIPATVAASPLRGYNNTAISAPAEVSDKSYAAFATINYKFMSQWEIALGGRYSVVDKKLVSFSENDPLRSNPATVASAAFASFSNFSDSKTFANISPKLTLTYHPTDTVTLYANVSRGFKAGGWNTGVVTQNTFNAGLQLNSETVTSYEAGLKSEWFDHRVRFNGNLFREAFENFQVTQYSPSISGAAVPRLANAGTAHSEGVEAEFEAILAPGLKFATNGSYTFARFDNFKNCVGLGVNCDGKRLPYAPNFKLYSAISYDFPLLSFADGMAAADFSMETKSYSNVDNSVAEYIPYHAYVDVKLGLVSKDGRWTATVYSKNVTDRLNQVYSQAGAFGDHILFYRPPRVTGVVLTSKF